MKKAWIVATVIVVLVIGVLVGLWASTLLISSDQTTTQTPPTSTTDEENSASEVARTDAPLYFSTMTHMEGQHTDDVNRAMFDRHVEQLRHALSLATAYNAKITVESEQPFARASIANDVNVLEEFVTKGQGVGTHCDVNPRMDYTPQQRVLELKKRKSLVDSLVGAANNRGCSGAAGRGDWAIGMIAAGFKYVDGVVGFHYLSMDESERPDGWTNDYIYETSYHEAAPEDLTLRYHPFFIKDAKDFVPDDDGGLLVSAGSVGTLQQLAEIEAEGVGYASCAPNCPLEKNDVDALVKNIREIALKHDGSHVGKIDVHIQAGDWDAANDETLRYFFTEINTLADEGLIQWATQGEVYDAVVAWEK